MMRRLFIGAAVFTAMLAAPASATATTDPTIVGTITVDHNAPSGKAYQSVHLTWSIQHELRGSTSFVTRTGVINLTTMSTDTDGTHMEWAWQLDRKVCGFWGCSYRADTPLVWQALDVTRSWVAHVNDGKYVLHVYRQDLNGAKGTKMNGYADVVTDP